MIEFLIPFIAFWFANITGIPQRIKKAWKVDKLRPFDCAKCLSFWISLWYQLDQYGWRGWDTVCIVAVSSLIGWLLPNIALKLKIPINV